MFSKTFFRHLRWQFVVAFVLASNAVCLLGVWLNGGLGRVKTAGGALVGAILGLSLAVVALFTLYDPHFRRYVLVADAPLDDMRIDFGFFALLGAVLALVSLYEAWQLLR